MVKGGTEPWEFQALFHNYIRAPADEVTISPLSALSYYDKTESSEEARKTPKVEQRYEVDVKKVGLRRDWSRIGF